MFKYRITVFTPTYNRAYIIEKLYRSLRLQKFTNFEWLVVDDGSSDNTAELFANWINDNNPFEIKYHKTENGGKHRAINYGLDYADGEIFFTVDSDDELTPDALEKIDKWFLDIRPNKSICGIVANKGFGPAQTVNSFFCEEFLDKNLWEMDTYTENGKLVLNGERAIAFYTQFHKKYRFPEFDGENFLTEAVVYNRMSNDGCIMRFYNDIVWIFEYLPDGLTSNPSIYLNNPMGYGLWLREHAKFRNHTLLQKLRMYYTFTCDLNSKYTTKYIAKCIGAPAILISMMKFLHHIYAIFKQR